MSKIYAIFRLKIFKIPEILTFSNQMLSFGSLRTAHAVCAKII